MNTADLTVVIPTRNRLESLKRLLASIAAQDLLPREIIVVDSSDQSLQLSELQQAIPGSLLKLISSEASVCIQRNKGIREAKNPYIFICDDDIELPPDYISKMMGYLQLNPDCGAVTGAVVQADHRGEDTAQFASTSLRELTWNFFFQLSIWADLDKLQVRGIRRLIYGPIRAFYRRRANTFSLAAWPLNSDFSKPVFRTAIYGIGASIVRREWLLNSLYDEVLDPHGIGDNYGVALGFPGHCPIHVLAEPSAYHHKIPDNRLPPEEAYFRRILALHYFMCKSPRFTLMNRLWLCWSLGGQWLSQLLYRQVGHRRASARALFLIMLGKNPYVRGAKQGQKIVTPALYGKIE